jgi:cysteine-rich repeat protein
MRRWIGLAVTAIGCGPLVAIDEGGASDGDSSSGRTSVDVTGGAEGEDGVPPNPSEPGDPSVDPDPTIDDSGPMTTVGTTGSVDPDCGDGILDRGEACDDGNNDDGDDCSAACTLPVEVLWTASYNGAASSFDVANDVLVAPDGSIWVVGTSRVTAAASDVWLQQYFADGSVGWSFTWDGAEALADEGEALAWTPSGRIAIVGSTESMATGDDILVLLVDPATGETVWSRVFDGPGSGAGEFDEVDGADDVAVDPSGNLVVAATIKVAPGDYDAWLGELAPETGELGWTRVRDIGEHDHAHALAVNWIGEVALLIEHEPDAAALTAFFADDGTPIDLELEHPFGAHDLVRRGDGGLSLVGVDDQGFDRAVVVDTLDDGFNPWWSQQDDGHGDDDGIGVAAGPSSELAAVGSRGVSGEQENAWIRVYRDDGTALWGATYNGGASLSDEFRAAVFDADGAVIAVGSATELGEQSNAIVRKYSAG